MDDQMVFAILNRLGVSVGEASAITGMAIGTTAFLKKAIKPLQGSWCILAAFVAAAFWSAMSFYPNVSQMIGVTIVCGVGAISVWQVGKDLIDRAHGKDTNVPDHRGETREEAGKP